MKYQCINPVWVTLGIGIDDLRQQPLAVRPPGGRLIIVHVFSLKELL